MRSVSSVILLGCLILGRPSGAVCIGRIPQQAKPIQSLAEQIREAPFGLACFGAKSLKDQPKNGTLGLGLPEQDLKGRNARDFLLLVSGRINSRIKGSREQLSQLELCRNHPKDEPCQPLTHWIEKDLPDFVHQARRHLSLSQSEHQWSTWFGATAGLNEDLNSLGSFKLTSWSPLTADEKKEADQTLAAYKKDVDQEIAKRRANKTPVPDEKAFRDSALIAVRYDHFQNYRRMMSVLPMMQYLPGPGVRSEDVTVASYHMKKKLEQESEFLRAREEHLRSGQALNGDDLDLLMYQQQVEEILMENPDYCGIATSLMYGAANRDLARNLGMGLPILGASLMAPPLAGALIGLAAGGTMAYESYEKLELSQRRSLGHVYGLGEQADDPRELQDLEDSQAMFKSDVLLLPTGLGLSSGLVRGVSRLVKVAR